MWQQLRAIWLIVLCSYYMIVICCYTIFMAALGKFTRRRADHILQWWARKTLQVLHLNVECHNPHQVNLQDGQPYLLMCNHTSLFDIPISYVALAGSLRMIAKIELTRIPLFGRALKSGQVPVIDRSNRHHAMKTLARARQLLHEGIVIWIAPEGTRSSDGTLLPFKKGGFALGIQAQAIIVPIVIQGAHRLLPKHSWRMNTHQTVHVHVGKPVDCKAYTEQERTELMQVVRTEMLKLLELREPFEL